MTRCTDESMSRQAPSWLLFNHHMYSLSANHSVNIIDNENCAGMGYYSRTIMCCFSSMDAEL